MNDPTPTLLANLKDATWLNGEKFPDVNYAVPGILPEGFAILAGPPKGGKSWMVLDWVLAAARGHRALGAIYVMQRPVLYLALEDSHRRLQSRSREILGDAPIPAFHYLLVTEPGRVIETIKEWMDTYGRGVPPLVVLDTLGKAIDHASSGESAYARDYRVGSALKRLADDIPGSVVLVNHHSRKAVADDFLEAVSGTNGLAGAADSVLLLVRPRMQEEAVLKVTGRDVDEREYALVTVEGKGWKLAGDDLKEAALNAAKMTDTSNLGERSSEMIEAVAAHPEGATAGQVAKTLGLDNPKHVGTYLARLVDSGKLVRPSRGKYAYRRVESVESVEYGPVTTHSTDSTPRCIRCGEHVDPVLGYHPACQSGGAA